MNVKNIPGLTQEQIESLNVEMKEIAKRKKLSALFIAAAGKMRGDDNLKGDPHSIERAQTLCDSWNTYAASEGSAIRICVESTQQSLSATVKPPTPGKVR